MHAIYFDNNATTPLAPEVLNAMLPCLKETFGNPSSGHRFGEPARVAMETGREQVAGLLNCEPSRIVFTSGGTESNNLAIWSAVWADPKKKHIVSSVVEHASVLSPLKFLKENGYEIELLPVDTGGAIDPDQLARVIRPDTALVTLMGANNETGVLWQLDAIAGLCREKGVLFHTDAVQMAGKVSLDLQTLPVDYLSLAAHKLHGPKGIGALYAHRSAPVVPFVMGADQENGRRPGTENVAGIAGFGMACELAGKNLPHMQKVSGLLKKLEEGILRQIPDSRINGQGAERLPNTLNISFKYCASAAMIQELDERGIAVSAHSACQSGDLDPSHVLLAMQVPEEYRHGTLRISLSRYSTEDEVQRLLDILAGIVARSRQSAAI